MGEAYAVLAKLMLKLSGFTPWIYEHQWIYNECWNHCILRDVKYTFTWTSWIMFTFRITENNPTLIQTCESYPCTITLKEGKNTESAKIICRKQKSQTITSLHKGGCACSVMSDLCNPMDCIPPGFHVHLIFQARVLEWVAISYFISLISNAKERKKIKLKRHIWLFKSQIKALAKIFHQMEAQMTTVKRKLNSIKNWGSGVGETWVQATVCHSLNGWSQLVRT